MTISRFEAVVQTDYHQFTIEAGPARELIHGQDPILPLGVFAGDIIRVRVGIRSGPVNVAVEVCEEAPGYNDGEWEDIAEGDLAQNSNDGVNILSFWDFEPRADGEDAPSLRGLTPPGNLRYRIRICARGKGIRFDSYLDGEPVEDYLIQLWPTTTDQSPVQIKNASGR
ncbi:hypothetical protein [Rhodococcus sp. (in: high G+C Gram-positive bacteria)]|uniref:hypothetical protein n=1 Tax=Rhodococcus sp. TaxID=1831 RepID=UPI003B8A82AF